MRKMIAVAVCLFATSAFAESNSFSVFVSNPGGGWSRTSGTTYSGGFGLEYERQLTARWSATASVARETYGATSGAALPLDLTARYHIFNGARWRPYAGAGVRYVRNPEVSGSGARITEELIGGIAFQLNRSFSVFGEVKQGLGRQAGPAYDPLTKTSFGLRFGF